MFFLREMNPLKASKKASTAANKIRNKILNTSSFFKVSLQTNNRALALALEAQKDRNRQLEKKVWLMQKEVEALCFQLASRNYKHRRLLMILKNLQRDTMEQLSSATDLLTSSEDNRTSSGQHEDSPAPGRIPESRGSIRTSVMNVREQLVCDAADQRCSEEVGPSRPSISLREEVERFSAALSQPILVPQSRQEVCPPAASTDEAPPPQGSRPEKTVLLNSSMEMTVCSDVDIVTVDTIARRQEKKIQNETRTSSGTGPALSHMDQEEKPESSAPKARFMRTALSRIPKLRPPEQRALPTADLDLDDYFKDPQRTSITCRKSRSRPRNTLVSIPDPDLLGPEDRPQPTRAVTCSRGSGKSRCRSTFVVALISSSDRVPQEDSPSEEPPNARVDALSSGKRSWEASEEQFVTPDLQEEVLTQDTAPGPAPEPASGPQTQKQKRARREEPGRSTKKTKKKKGLAKDSNVEPSFHPNTDDTCGASPAPPEGNRATPPESDGGHAFSPPLRSRNLRDTFVFYQIPTPDQSKEHCDFEMLMDEPPPWVGGASVVTPHGETQRWRKDENLQAEQPQEEPGLLDRRSVEKKTKKKKGTMKSSKDKKEPSSSSNTNRKEACGAPPPPPDHLHMKSSQSDVSEEVRAQKRAEPPQRRTKKKGLNKDSNMEPSSHPITNLEEQLDTCGAPPPPEGKQATPPESDKPKPLCRRTFSPPLRSRTLRETFEFHQGLTPNQSEEGGVSTATPHREGGGVSMATPHREGGGVSTATPHREGGGVSTATPHREEGGVSTATPHREEGGVSTATPHRQTLNWRTTQHVVNASPGRVLTSLTNTLTTPEGEVGGRGRRRHAVVSYREPTLNSKMRRGDKFTETTFLSSPQFRDAKKKKRQKKGAGLTAASNTEDCFSVFMN